MTPDLTCLGKIVGGGLPVGAFGGRQEILELVAPLGPVYQAGTLSGNPLAMAAGRATLEVLRSEDPYPQLEQAASTLCSGIVAAAGAAGVALQVNRVASMFTAFFTAAPVTDYASAKRADGVRYGSYFHAMLERGVYLAPSAFEAAFVSTGHGAGEVGGTAESVGAALKELS